MEIQDLLAYWEIPWPEWSRFIGGVIARKAVIAFLFIIGWAVGMKWILRLLSGSDAFLIGMDVLFIVFFLTGAGMLVALLWRYRKVLRTDGSSYVYLNRATTPFDKAGWSLPGLDNTGLAGPRLMDVRLEYSGALPRLVFICGAIFRSKTIIPVPSENIRQAEEVYDYFHELLRAGRIGVESEELERDGNPIPGASRNGAGD